MKHLPNIQETLHRLVLLKNTTLSKDGETAKFDEAPPPPSR